MAGNDKETKMAMAGLLQLIAIALIWWGASQIYRPAGPLLIGALTYIEMRLWDPDKADKEA